MDAPRIQEKMQSPEDFPLDFRAMSSAEDSATDSTLAQTETKEAHKVETQMGLADHGISALSLEEIHQGAAVRAVAVLKSRLGVTTWAGSELALCSLLQVLVLSQLV